jgi:hypothetical protein
MIVKIQLSQFPYHEMFLAYDKSRKFEAQGNVDSNVLAAMKGKEKAYFECTVENGHFEIGEQVQDQDW